MGVGQSKTRRLRERRKGVVVNEGRGGGKMGGKKRGDEEVQRIHRTRRRITLPLYHPILSNDEDPVQAATDGVLAHHRAHGEDPLHPLADDFLSSPVQNPVVFQFSLFYCCNNYNLFPLLESTSSRSPPNRTGNNPLSSPFPLLIVSE